MRWWCLLWSVALWGAESGRWSLPTPAPHITKAVQPSKFLSSVGHHAALLGREDGTFEAWIYPVKLLRGFQLSVYFDGSLEPVPLSDLAETVTAGPGRVTITHAHAAFTIRQTWVAAVDQPAAVVLLDIDTSRPLRLRASFQPEAKPMWPASFGGQSTGWQESRHAIAFSEGSRRFTALVGSPAFQRHSEQVGHQTPDKAILLEADVTPQQARAAYLPIVFAGGMKGEADTEAVYDHAVRDLPALVAASDRYWRGFQERTLQVFTSDSALNEAFVWAKLALERGWACSEGVGCGLVAGWGPSGASERPGFGWYFGGDALINSWSLTDYGDFARTRAVLEFLRAHQRADGKMMHEWTQSGTLVDWARLPYAYYHADTTPLYLYSAARYVRQSGDVGYLRDSWDSLERAYQYCVTTLDDDGLMSNRKAGAAAVETGALSGRVAKDIYLAGAWLAGLDGYVRMAEMTGRAPAAQAARKQMDRARATVNGWFSPATGHLPFGWLTDGTVYSALSGWQAFALGYGGLDPERSERAAGELTQPSLSTDWGVRLFATDSPAYDPLSYNDGSVWPFVTGFAITAEYRNHRVWAAWQHLRGLVQLTGFSGAGLLSEYFSGERAQALPRSVPHQLFSSSALVHPLVSGMLGLNADASAQTLRLRPHLPPYAGAESGAQEFVEFSNYRMGPATIRGTMTRTRGNLTVNVESSSRVHLILSPAFAPGTSELKAYLGKKKLPLDLERSSQDVHARVELPIEGDVTVVFTFREGIPLQSSTRALQPGDSSQQERILRVIRQSDQEVTVQVALGTAPFQPDSNREWTASMSGTGPVRTVLYRRVRAR